MKEYLLFNNSKIDDSFKQVLEDEYRGSYKKRIHVKEIEIFHPDYDIYSATFQDVDTNIFKLNGKKIQGKRLLICRRDSSYTEKLLDDLHEFVDKSLNQGEKGYLRLNNFEDRFLKRYPNLKLRDNTDLIFFFIGVLCISRDIKCSKLDFSNNKVGEKHLANAIKRISHYIPNLETLICKGSGMTRNDTEKLNTRFDLIIFSDDEYNDRSVNRGRDGRKFKDKMDHGTESRRREDLDDKKDYRGREYSDNRNDKRAKEEQKEKNENKRDGLPDDEHKESKESSKPGGFSLNIEDIKARIKRRRVFNANINDDVANDEAARFSQQYFQMNLNDIDQCYTYDAELSICINKQFSRYENVTNVTGSSNIKNELVRLFKTNDICSEIDQCCVNLNDLFYHYRVVYTTNFMGREAFIFRNFNLVGVNDTLLISNDSIVIEPYD